MENKYSVNGIENRMIGGKSGQLNSRNVLQQKAPTRQVLGSIWNKNEINVSRVQPERAVKQIKNQQRKPLTAIDPIKTSTNYTSHIYNNLGGNHNNIRNSKISREPPSNENANKPKFFVYCDPAPTGNLDNTMEVEEAPINHENIFPPAPIRPMNAEALRDLHYQQQLAYIRHFPDFENNKETLLKQWQQQQQAPYQQERQQTTSIQQESKEDVLKQILEQQKCVEEEEDVDPSSYSDMDMDREEDEEDDGVVDDEEEEEEGVAMVKGVVIEDGELMMMREYRNEIYKNCRDSEMHYQARPDYMKKQFDLTHTMRSILVDWMVEVVDEYHLKRETLFLAVNYVDRFLSLMSVIRGKLQLLGAAAMFVAAKYEEIYPPDVAQFVYITDDTYTVKQILQMEQVLLKTLHFSTAPPTSNFFATELLSQLSVRCIEVDADDQWMHLTMYMLEQSLLDGEEFMGYKASLLASSAVLLSNQMIHDKPCAHKIRQLTGYTTEDMSVCLTSLQSTLLKSPSYSQQAIHSKYCSDKYQQVAKLAVPQQISDNTM